MTSSKTDRYILIGILLLILCVILYLITFGQVNVISDVEAELREKRRIAEQRLLELESRLNIQTAKKKQLDRLVAVLFITFKAIVFTLFILGNLWLKKIFYIDSWASLFEANVKVLGCFGILLFFFIGEEVKFARYYKYLRAMIKTFIYRKYVTLEQDVIENQSETEEIRKFLQETAPVVQPSEAPNSPNPPHEP